MVEFINVCYSVLDGHGEKRILEDISFKLPRTGLVALTGKSGSGKTTILNLISNTISKTSGSIIVDNYNYDELSLKQIDEIRAHHISIVYQDLELIDKLSLKENIELACKIKDVSFDLVYDKYKEYLNMLDISNFEDEKVVNLSGGERQRVAVLRAIITNPSIILLDEPTASLDKNNAKIIMDFLKKISSDVLILFTSHDVNLIKSYTDQVISIDYGQIIENTAIYKEDNIQSVADNQVVSHKKNNLAKVYYASRKIFKKSTIITIISSIFLAISSVLAIISCTTLNKSVAEYVYDAYRKTDYNVYYISEVEKCLFDGESDPSIESFGLEHIQNVLNKEYNLDIKKSLYNFIKSTKYKDLGHNLIENNSYGDFEIGITDYTLKKLVDDKVINEKNVIGSEITIGNFTFKIKKIIGTNYKWFEPLSGKTRLDYLPFVELSYRNVYLNEKTMTMIYNDIIPSKKSSLSGKECVVYDIDKVRYSIKYGDADLSDDEIMISFDFARELLNKDISVTEMTEEDFNTLRGRKINFNGKEYFIAAVGAGYSSCVALSKENYQAFICEIDQNDVEYYFELPDKKTSISLINDILRNDEVNLISPYTNDVLYLATDFKSLKVYIKYFFIASVVLVLLSAFILINNLFNKHKKEIGVLRSLGMKKNNILLLFLLHVLKIIFLSMIIAILVYSFGWFTMINISYVDYYSFVTWVVDYNIVGVLLYLLFNVLMICAVFGIIYYMFSRKNIQELLKNK